MPSSSQRRPLMYVAGYGMYFPFSFCQSSELVRLAMSPMIISWSSGVQFSFIHALNADCLATRLGNDSQNLSNDDPS